tara:strand:- start:45 stop:1010 length:966 start_codon:yes stop_codon:yes gene_type:complete
MSASAPTGADMMKACASVEDKMDAGVKGLWLAVKEMDPELAAPVIASFYNGQVAPLLAAQEEEKKEKDAKKEYVSEAKTKWIKKARDRYAELEEQDRAPKLLDKKLAAMALYWKFEEITGAANTHWEQVVMKKKRGKKKASGERRKASDDAEEWIQNSKEDAEKDYEDPNCYATQVDLDNKTTYLENAKLYKAGQKDPREKGKVLEKDLVKKVWRSCVRRGATFHDKDDGGRCPGAKIFKAGRYGSQYTLEQGIRGAATYQCGARPTNPGDFCADCEKRGGKNFFEMKYKKTERGDNVLMAEFMTQCIPCGEVVQAVEVEA